MDKNKISLNNLFPYLALITSMNVFPLGKFFLNFPPKLISINNGNAVPNAYPITAPIPPHVAADAGPNNIQAPKAEAMRLDVKENTPMDLFAN